MDKSNSFSKVVQGYIVLDSLAVNPTPKLRVNGSIGHVDLHVADEIFDSKDFEVAVNAMYDKWEEELRETVVVLTPDAKEASFSRMSPSELKETLREEF